MPLSNDPGARARQIANLKPNAAAIDGGYSKGQLASLRGRYVVELQQRFPSADRSEIALLAHRQAQLAVLGAWQDRRGLLADQRRGVPFPAVQLHERIAAAFERQYA